MLLPNKLTSGNFKKETIKTVNQIIDYLRGQRIVVDNKTTKKKETNSGTIITAKPKQPQMKAKSGGTNTTIYKDQFYICRLTGVYDEVLGYEAIVYLDNNTSSQNTLTTYIRFTVADGVISENVQGRYVLAKVYPTIVYGGES